MIGNENFVCFEAPRICQWRCWYRYVTDSGLGDDGFVRGGSKSLETVVLDSVDPSHHLLDFNTRNMSLFRRCQRLHPLIAKNAVKPQFASVSFVQIRNGGGGHGFPRAAWDLSTVREPAKFPKYRWDPNDNEPEWFLFMRSDLTGKTPPKETTYLFIFLLVSWGYGLWYHSRWNPNHH